MTFLHVVSDSDVGLAMVHHQVADVGSAWP